MNSLPDDWISEELSRITLLVTDGKHGDCRNEIGSGYFFISAKDILNGEIDYSNARQITQQDFLETDKRTSFQPNDIVLTNTGSIGKIAVGRHSPLTRRTTFQKSVAVIKPDSQLVEPYYLSQMLLYKQKELEQLATGSSQKNLLLRELRSVAVPLPPLPEQRRIAEILGTWDETIALTGRLIDALRDRKKGLMQRLLSGEVRFPEFVHRNETQSTEFGEIPADWEVVRQGDVATFHNGRAYAKTEWEKSGTPVIRLQNLTGRGDEFYYSTMQLPEKQYVNRGDLLYMWSATFGPHIWDGEQAIYHYHIWKVECGEKLDKIYMYYLLGFLTDSWMSDTHGMGILHITKGNMEGFSIPLPPIPEQHKIGETLSACDTEIQLLEQYTKRLRDQKRGLMQQLLTGQIRVGV